MKRSKIRRRPSNISGPRIKAARLARRPSMSQEQLCERLQARGVNMDQTALSKVESQVRGVTDLELQAIARCLKTTIARLCGERAAGR